MAATVERPYRPGAGIRKVTGDTWHGSTTRPVDPITGNPDEAINNDIATVRDAFKRYEAETGIDPATLPREQQREIALGGLNALDQSGVRSGDAVLRNGSTDWARVPDIIAQRTNGRFHGAPVRLMIGVHRGPSRGYGLAHIQESHARELAAIGMTAAEYIDSVLSRANEIYDAGDGSLVLRAKGKPNGSAVVELRDEGDHYSVITAYDVPRRGKLVWSGRPGELAQRVPGQSETAPDSTTSTPSGEVFANRVAGTGQSPRAESLTPGRFAIQTAGSIVPLDHASLKQPADGNKKAPRGQIVGRDGQSIIGQKAENGSREFNITLFEGKDLSTVLRARRRQGEATLPEPRATLAVELDSGAV